MRLRPFRLSSYSVGCALWLTGFAAHAAAPADFAACLAQLRASAPANGVSPATFDSATADLEPNDVLHFQDEQPEFTTPVWDYMAGLVDQERVDDGKAMLARYGDALSRIEARFGVSRYILVALWGVESDYGRNVGYRPIVQSLATLSCYGHKPQYYQGELYAALAILQRGEARPDHFVGSWAGAFGHTQFMPSTFSKNAVDVEGDGHPNIIDSVPDALGSTANYLRKSGWTTGVPWGFEVKLPPGYTGPAGRKNHHPMAFWAARGLKRVDGSPLGSGSAGLLLPAGRNGPAFLVTNNFEAIFAYNSAEVYALAIGHLSDRLRGGGPLVTPWPTDDPGLARVDRRQLQDLLAGKGFDIGNHDGVMGTKTRAAIASYQQSLGMKADGRASASVLKALQEGR
jgi:lytic murein transglycosylase